MEFNGLVCYCFMFLFIGMNYCSGSRLGQFDQGTIVKSIKSSNGDVIDCVRANNSNQSAFDLQKRISGSFNTKKSIAQSWHSDGSCPEGTIAVKRTTHEEAIRANSIKSHGIRSFHGNNFKTTSNAEAYASTNSTGFVQFATVSVDGEFYGAMASMSIWAPNVRSNELSSSQIWVAGGSGSDLNAVVAGWHVYPELYGDNQTRFYIYWTADNFNSTGCYNLYCTGFVHTSNKIALGAPFPFVSKLDGLQAEFQVIIFKGRNGWYLQLNDFVVGYWPFSLFTNLKTNASFVEWGGIVFNSQIDGKQSTTTQMGSGHFPEEGFQRAGFMRNLQVFNETLYSRKIDTPTILAAQPNCYNVTLAHDKNLGDLMLYGGPGRNPKCP